MDDILFIIEYSVENYCLGQKSGNISVVLCSSFLLFLGGRWWHRTSGF